jgi:membrane-associated phospholipid phosphatase
MKKRKLLTKNYMLDTYVNNNFNNLKFSYLFIPFFLLLLIVFVLFIQDAFSVESYTQIQKDSFLYLNSKFSKFPDLQFNLTQLGDVIIFLPFLTIFIIYAPKFWHALLSSIIISGIFSFLLKKLFAVPRPAAVFDNDSFLIIGNVLTGNTSLPSGHSIAAFTILALVFFAFIPKEMRFKIIWFFSILIIGLIIVFTRVGVGAHYPLDILIGSIVGLIAALLGVFINKKYNPWAWIGKKKYYPVFIFVMFIWAIALINKIITDNLMIFYFSLASLIITLFIIINIYVKK